MIQNKHAYAQVKRDFGVTIGEAEATVQPLQPQGDHHGDFLGNRRKVEPHDDRHESFFTNLTCVSYYMIPAYEKFKFTV